MKLAFNQMLYELVAPLKQPTAGNVLMELLIHVEGGTEPDRQRGIAAARRVFEAGGAHASDCACAAFERNKHRRAGAVVVGLSQHQLRQADLWDRAELAGIEACCIGMDALPRAARLDLRFGDIEGVDSGCGATRRPGEPVC